MVLLWHNVRKWFYCGTNEAQYSYAVTVARKDFKAKPWCNCGASQLQYNSVVTAAQQQYSSQFFFCKRFI